MFFLLFKSKRKHIEIYIEYHQNFANIEISIFFIYHPALTHTQHISSSIANLTASWYFIKIKYSEPNISAPASASPLAFAVLLLAVIKQRCIAAGAPFWIGGELPIFVVRPHAPNRDACTVTVRYEYMYHATPNIQWHAKVWEPLVESVKM